VWHGSVALIRGGRPVPTARASERARRIGGELARYLLEDVGTGETIEEAKEVAFHARRSLSDPEIAQLDPAWLAIEPVDMG
jgi:hypothetical protein